MKQRKRDLVTGELTLNYFSLQSAAGWRIASIEWERDGDEAALPNVFASPAETAVPFGLQVSPTSPKLEENAWEASVLLLVLEQIVSEKRIPEIAHQLNRAGYSTREGIPWSPTAVFNLLPRLIEVGPAVLKSHAWAERRTH